MLNVAPFPKKYSSLLLCSSQVAQNQKAYEPQLSKMAFMPYENSVATDKHINAVWSESYTVCYSVK